MTARPHQSTVAILALLLALPGTGLAQSNEEAVEAAKQSAQEWLALLDADKYEATWEAAAPSFQANLTAEQWAKQLQKAHRTLDSLRSRSLVEARYTTSIPNPNAPDGEYVIAQYRATYGEANTIETLVLIREKGEWGVIGYRVQPE